MELTQYISNPLNWVVLAGTFSGILAFGYSAWQYIKNREMGKLLKLAHTESMKLVKASMTSRQKREMLVSILRSAAPAWLDPFITEEKLKYLAEKGYRMYTKPEVQNFLHNLEESLSPDLKDKLMGAEMTPELEAKILKLLEQKKEK
jgi:hypothetical protein